jgi:tetratricopeptide (TPR) repeat protein
MRRSTLVGRTWRALALVALTAALAPSERVQAQHAPATAAEPDGARRASDHFRRGVELYQEGAYRAAIVEFKRAYEIAPNYRLLYNIAQTQIQLLDYHSAAQAYEAYLAEGGADVPEARRREVEDALGALRERIGRLSITVSVAGAEILVDDVKVGVSPLTAAVPVNVGRHRIQARTADGAEASQILEVAGGDLLELKLEPKKAAVAVTAPSQPVEAPRRARLSKSEKYAIAGLGLGVAAAGTAVFAGLSAKKNSEDLERALDARPNDPGKVADLRDSTQMLARTADSLAAVAVLALAASVTLWALDGSDDAEDDESTTAKLSVGAGSLTVTGRF